MNGKIPSRRFTPSKPQRCHGRAASPPRWFRPALSPDRSFAPPNQVVEEQLSSHGNLEDPTVDREITGVIEQENPSFKGLFKVISKEVSALVLFKCTSCVEYTKKWLPNVVPCWTYLIGMAISVRTFTTRMVTKYHDAFVAVLLLLMCLTLGLLYLLSRDNAEFQRLDQDMVECKNALQQLETQSSCTTSSLARFVASDLGHHVLKGTPWNPTTGS